MPSGALSTGEDCLGRVCPSHPSLPWEPCTPYGVWMDTRARFSSSLTLNFVFALPGNPRLGHKRRPRRAATVSGGETGLARVGDRHSVIREAQREAKPALL